MTANQVLPHTFSPSPKKRIDARHINEPEKRSFNKITDA